MSQFKRLVKSTPVWALIISISCVLFYLVSQYQTNADEYIEYSDDEFTPSQFSLTTDGKVEVEGGIVNLSASQTGTFKKVYVKEGDTVEIGQLLAEQESRDDVIAVRNAKIDVENAKIQLQQDTLNLAIQVRNLERATIEFEEEAISKSDYERVQDQVEQTKLNNAINQNNLEKVLAQLETAELNLNRRRIISPVNGQIFQAAVNAGAGVSSSNVTVAFKIIPDASKNIRVKLSERDVDKVFLNQPVSIQKDVNSETIYQGSVVSIGKVFSSAVQLGDVNSLDVIISTDDIPFRLGKNVIVRFSAIENPVTELIEEAEIDEVKSSLRNGASDDESQN